MNAAKFDAACKKLVDEADAIQKAKRPGYTLGNEDVLRNFKATADRAGITPEQAWTIYFLKHIDAITSIMTRPELPVAEAPIGRFADAINYLKLGWGLLEERRETAQAVQRLEPVSMMTQEPVEKFTSWQLDPGVGWKTIR